MNDSLVGEKTIALSIAQEILSTSVEIPAIPENIRQIFVMVRQPEDKIDIPEFAKLVEGDPGLFTRILQLANSRYYSEMERIVTLRAAITRIGLKETVNSVCLQFFRKLLPQFPDIDGLSYTDFWAHSWACAVANRRLGHPMLGMEMLPGDLYMAGMLHGLGKLLMAIQFPEKFAACVAKARQFECPLHEVERDMFGTTDGLVAARVLKAWQLPTNICEGVGYWQMPEHAQPEYIVIAGMTQYAYAIAGLSGVGASGDGCNLDLSKTFLGQKPALSLSKESTQTKLLEEIFKSLEDKSFALNPESKTVKSAYDVADDSSTSRRAAPSTPRKKQVKQPQKPKGIFGWIRSLFRGN
ncbi:MAG: HDOD domain-containing protein [Desulfobacterales bacterium]|nr:HDOD domain-containing protein [Desulfobacterales bacterium]